MREKGDSSIFGEDKYMYLYSADNVKRIKCEGYTLFSNSKDKYHNSILVEIYSPDCSLPSQLELIEYSKQDQLDDVTPYIIISLSISIVLIIGVAKLTLDCYDVDNAKRTSIYMVGMQCFMDVFLCFWNFKQMFYHQAAYEYFIITALFTSGSAGLMYGKLLRHIYAAQYAPQYHDYSENMFMTFKSRFFAATLLPVLVVTAAEISLEYVLIISNLYMIPQIAHNAFYYYKKSVNLVLMFVITATRTTFFLYIFGCPKNFLILEPRSNLCIVFLTLMLSQFFILCEQSTQSGPRFFIPKILRPNYYDYYRNPEEEKSLSSEDECLICLHQLNDANQDIAEDQSRIMHTPCKHKFHETCFVRWMSQKMICPACRYSLPVIED